MVAAMATMGRGMVQRLGLVARGLLAPLGATHHDAAQAIRTTGPLATYRVAPGSYRMIVSDTAGGLLTTVVEVAH